MYCTVNFIKEQYLEFQESFNHVNLCQTIRSKKISKFLDALVVNSNLVRMGILSWVSNYLQEKIIIEHETMVERFVFLLNISNYREGKRNVGGA